MTIPSMKACCSDEGRVREKLEQPNIIRRLSEINCYIFIYIYTHIQEKVVLKTLKFRAETE